MLMESHQHEESSKDMNTRVVAEDGGGSSSGGGGGGGGTSRFYECTFCKQGFTTAQALGGHMNIHRRERARIRQPIVIPSSSIPIQQSHGHEKHTRPDFPWPISGSTFPQAQDYHHMYPPSSTSSASTPTNRHPHPSVHVDNSQNRIPRSMRFFEEDQSTNLSLRIGYPTEEVNNQFGAEDDEVDLELRLGHDP